MCKQYNVVQTSDTSASLMCAPPDTDPVVGAGPAHRDTVNSLVLETLLVIRTRHHYTSSACCLSAVSVRMGRIVKLL